MKKFFSLSLGLLVITSLSGCCCWKKKQEQPCKQVEEAQEEKAKPVKQARTSGTHPKEVGWQEEDLA